jgi:hypothetical protein
VRVHGGEGTGVPAAAQRAQHRAPDGGGTPARPDDGDRPRPQQRAQARRGREPGPVVHGREVGVDVVEPHRDVDDVVLALGAQWPAKVLQHAQHPVVACEDIGDQGDHPVGLGDGDQLLDQQRAEPARLVAVGDGHRELGAVGPRAGVAGGPEQLAAPERPHGGPAVVRVGHQALDVERGVGPAEGEEPRVAVLGGQLGVQADQGGAVLGVQPPEFDGVAVGAAGPARAGALGGAGHRVHRHPLISGRSSPARRMCALWAASRSSRSWRRWPTRSATRGTWRRTARASR